MMDKKGQGLSLNVIIIAALALIVLVVLIAIFMGRIAIFQDDVNQAGQTEVIKMKITYGQCKPTATEESNFATTFSLAKTIEDKESARGSYGEEISRCKGLGASEDECKGQGCRWG